MKLTRITQVTVAAGMLATLGLGLGACSYLDVEPVALNTTENTFSTVGGATGAVIGAYDLLSGDQTYGTRISTYFPYDTDEMISSSGLYDTGRRGIARYKAFASNTDIVNPWNNLYQGIERANICIQQIPQMALYNGGAAADTAALHRLHGEALTIRAQFMYELVRNWGDVPVQFSPSVSGEDFNLPNADRNGTLERLIADLAVAEKLVPWRSNAGVANERITKGAVKALRARIAMQRGGFALRGSTISRPSDYLDYYRIARLECRELMAQPSQHALNPSFENIWRSVNQLVRDPSNEIIFEVGMSGSTASGDSKLGYYNGPRLNASPTYGSTQGAVTVVPTYFYAFDSLDVRRDITVAPYQYASGANVQSAVALNTIYDGKFRRDWHMPALPGTSNYLGYNWPLIRFADVLLMFAEAQNELDGPAVAFNGTTPTQALLAVRTRAFAGNATRAAAGLNLASKESFFDALVNERLLEFGSEGIRKYDLLRWNKLAQKINEAKANLALMQAGAAPYQNVPTTQYFTVVNGVVRFSRSFYRPAPATAPAGTTSVAWRSSIGSAYIANLQPSGTTVTVGSTSVISGGTGLAAEYLPGQGKELLPIPQTTLDADINLRQNFNYN